MMILNEDKVSFDPYQVFVYNPATDEYSYRNTSTIRLSHLEQFITENNEILVCTSDSISVICKKLIELKAFQTLRYFLEQVI